WYSGDRNSLPAVVPRTAKPVREERQGVAVPELEFSLHVWSRRFRGGRRAEQEGPEDVVRLQQLALLGQGDEGRADTTGRDGGQPARAGDQLLRCGDPEPG